MVSFDALKTAISGLRNWANGMFVSKPDAKKDIDTINNKFDEIQNELINLDNELDAKVDKINGKQLSSNDYTTTEKDKLAGIASGATKIQYVYETSTGRQRFNYSGNVASKDYTHAEGYKTTASGTSSHAEGNSTTASGTYSHTEGTQTTASGSASHAEGAYSKASADYSHAEGNNTKASGMYSHAEGGSTEASADYSHAEGNGTKAFSLSQHVQGRYNIEDDANKYAHIVGNGTRVLNNNQLVTTPSNAHTLDWDGLGWFAGGLKVGGTGQDDETAQNIATEDYVNEQINNTVTNLGNSYAERTLLEGFDLKINNQWSYSRDPVVYRVEFYDGEDLVGTAYTTTVSYSSGYSFSYFQNTQEVWDNIKKYKCLIYDSEGTQFAPVNFFYTAYWIGNILCTSSDGEKLDPITSFDVNNPYGRKIVGEIETIKLLMQTHYAEIFDAINANYTDILDIIDTPKNYVILNSSTEGSTKKFKLTIGDDGIISTEEVIE